MKNFIERQLWGRTVRAVSLLLLLASPAVLQAQFAFTTNNGTITITGYTGSSTVVNIPSRINGLPVTSIGDNAFNSDYNIVSVTIPSGIVSIGDSAFSGCGLTNVIIPNSVTSIGVYSFSGCNMTNITIGRGVTNIADYAFADNENLLHVTIPNNVVNIGEYSFTECLRMVSLTIGNSVTNIQEGAFFDDRNIIRVSIPNSVVAIGLNTFYNCFSLTNVIIGNGVTSIGTNCFSLCSGMIHLSIGSNVTDIANSAFYGDGSLVNVSIPDCVVSIGDFAFTGCASLTNATIGNGVTGIGIYSFGECSSLSKVTIGSSVTNISDSAFSVCTGLASISVNTNNVAYSSVGGVLFDRSQTTLILFPPADVLTTYRIPDSVIDINDSAFWECTDLTDIFIGNDVTNIGSYAFDDCDNLVDVYFKGNAPNADDTLFGGDNISVYYLPGTLGWDATFGGIQPVPWLQQGPFTYTLTNGVAVIDRYIGTNGTAIIPDAIEGLPVTSVETLAFAGCSSLTNVIIGTNVTSIGQNAFINCGQLASVTIPDSVTDIEGGVFQNCGLITINIPNSVTNLGPAVFPGCLSLTNAIIGDNVPNIGFEMFSSCGNLASVMIPDSVTNIDEFAFANCGLVSVDIPNSVTSLGQDAFQGCGQMVNVNISTNVETIGTGAFSYCSKLHNATIPDSISSIGDYAFQYCSSLTSVVISDSVTNIGRAAFSGCALTDVIIPNSVMSIEEGAFSSCLNLAKVVVGTNVGTIYFAAFYGCSNLTGLYFEGNAPSMVGASVFGSDPKATIYYLPGTAGWTSPFYGLPAVELNVTKPTVAIVSPLNGQRWTNSALSLKGTAGDKALVSSVWFSVNSNGWQQALTSNQWANWTATVNFIPGTNIIQATATNVFGYGSTGVSVKLDYVVTNLLQVQTVGAGTLSPNYSNSLLEIGRNYSIKATAINGFAFTNWTISTNWIGGLVTNGATVQFMMTSNLTLQAVFVDTNKPALTITAPTANQKMTSAFASVTGTAHDNWKVSGVWYQLNNAAWNLAPTTNSWTNWNTTLPLIAGTNNIKAYAMDLSGNYSATNSVSFVSSNTFMLQLNFLTQKPLLANGLTFALQLSSNLTGHIQYSTNLLNWISWTNFKGTNSAITFRDPAATNSARRFYRAVVP